MDAFQFQKPLFEDLLMQEESIDKFRHLFDFSDDNSFTFLDELPFVLKFYFYLNVVIIEHN